MSKSLPDAGAGPTSHDEDKILGIELLRFASALAVLVFHYVHFAYLGTAVRPGFDPAAQPFYRWLKLFYTEGFYGVEVFWCISGFIFFWKYERQILERTIGAYRFFALRVSRLYPLHFVTLLFMAGMQLLYRAGNGDSFVYSDNDLHHFVLQLAMASNWSTERESFNGPIWSISIEVLVYALFFVSLRFISGSVLLLVAIALAAAAVQLLGLSTHPVFPCIMFFYLGCVAAWVYGRQKRRPRLGAATTAGAVLVVAAALAASLLIGIKPKYFLVLASPPLIFLCVKHIPSWRSIARWLVPAGNMTYSSYLLHVPIQITVVTICGAAGWRVPLYQPAFFLAFLALTLFLSYWSYRLFEMPLQSHTRRRLLRPRQPALARAPNPT